MKNLWMLTAFCAGFLPALCLANETAQWQDEVDRVSRSGGGTVKIPSGRHLVAGLALKSGVTLELAEGCILEGTTNISDYADIHLKYAEVHEPWQAVIWAEDQHDVAIIGKGTIFGNGSRFPAGSRLGRPRGALFHRCRNVRVEGIHFLDLASWTCYYKECDGVIHRRVTVDSHANWNTDGVDIEAKNVLVEDCVFDTGDDGIVLKSDNPYFVVENVEVRNCDIGTECNIFKIGTASHGGFRNIQFHDVKGHAPRHIGERPSVDQAEMQRWRLENWPGSKPAISPLGGIVVEGVDGGDLRDISFRNIEISEACVPIFIRAGLRHNRDYGVNEMAIKIPFGTGLNVSGIVIENVRVRASSFTASSITGVPGLRVKDVTLRNVDIEIPGAGKAGLSEIGKPVPEKAGDYPESSMFDSRMLPACGFYVRHADGVRFDNVRIRCTGSDPRPEILLEDCTDVRRNGKAMEK